MPALIEILPAIIAAIKDGPTMTISMIWAHFFAALDLPGDKMGCVRDKLFGNPASAVLTVAHIVEDYLRDNAHGRGAATMAEIWKAGAECGLSQMQNSKVRMMWYYLWGNDVAARAQQYYTWTHDNMMTGALNGMTDMEKDSIYQYLSMNEAGRAEYLASSPPKTWSAKFMAAMLAASKALGIPVPFGAGAKGGGASASSGGGAGVPIAIAAAAALFAATR